MPTDRQQAIFEHLSLHGFAAADELGKALDASAVTIRREFARMEEAGLVTRVHGGAKLAESAAMVTPLSWRIHRNEAAKKRIGAYAASLVRNGETLLLDSGSTCFYAAQALPERLGVRVITLSLANVNVLAHKPQVQVICPGGELNRELGVFCGPVAEEALEGFHADRAFLGAAQVNAEQGTVNDATAEHRIKRMMHAHADSAHLLLDSSKFGVRGFHRGISPEEFRGDIITDSNIDPEQRALFAKRNIRITVVDD